MNKKHLGYIILFPLVLTLWALRKTLFVPGIYLFGEFPGSNNVSFTFNNLLHSWSPYLGFGHSTIGFPETIGGGTAFGTIPQSTQIFWLGYRTLLEKIFGSYGDTIYIFLGIFLSFVGIWFLSQHIFAHSKYKNLVSLIASLVYVLNPQFIIRTTVGTFRYHYIHAIFPLLILGYYKFAQATEKRRRIFYLSGLSLMSALTVMIVPHYLVLFAIFWVCDILGRLLLRKSLTEILPYIWSGLIVGLVGVFLNLSTFISSWMWKGDLITPTGQYFSLSAMVFGEEAQTISNMIRLNTFSYTQDTFLQSTLFILPILAILGTVVTKRKIGWFWLLLGAFGVIMATGVFGPFGELKKWAFLNLPLMSAFRDPTKILALTVLAYAILIGFFTDWLMTKKGNKTFFVSILVIIILFLGQPFFTGNFDNKVKKITLPNEYLTNNLQGRVATKPAPGYLTSYDWYLEQGDNSTQDNPLAFISPNKNIELVSVATPRNNRSYRFIEFWLNAPHSNEEFIFLSEVAGTNQILQDSAEGVRVEKLNFEPQVVSYSKSAILSSAELKDAYGINQNANLPVIFTNDLNLEQLKDLATKEGLIAQNIDEDIILNTMLLKRFVLPSNELTWHGLRQNQEFIMAESLSPEWSARGINMISQNSFVGDVGAKLTLPINAEESGRLIIRVLDNGTHAGFKIKADGLEEEIILNEELAVPFGFAKPAPLAPQVRWYSWPVGQIQEVAIEIVAGAMNLDGLAFVPNDDYEYYKNEISLALQQISSNNDAQLAGMNKIDGSEKDWVFNRVSYSPDWRLGEDQPFVAYSFAQVYAPNANRSAQSFNYVPAKPYVILVILNALLLIGLTGLLLYTWPKKDPA